MNRQRNIRAYQDEEIEGECHMLHAHSDGDRTKCDIATRGQWAFYCLDCFHLIEQRIDYESTRMFPPLDENGNESRWLFVERDDVVRLLTEEEFSLYGESNHALFVGRVGPNPNWDDRARDLFSVYTIRCEDGSIYIGQTRGDASIRVKAHRDGHGSSWIRDRGFASHMRTIMVANRQVAMEFEKALYLMFKSAGLRSSMGSMNDD